MKSNDSRTKIVLDDKYFETLMDIIEGKKVVSGDILKTLIKEGRIHIARVRNYNERKYLRLDSH